MHPIHERMAELFIRSQAKPLTPDEENEFLHCQKINVDLCYKVALLKNFSVLASMTGDVDWQHQICEELEIVRHD